MPLVVRGRKRRAEPEPTGSPESSASPEPAPQRRRVTPPSSPEPEEAADDDANSTNINTTVSAAATTTLDTAVKKLVRLALASEYQRRPIRRQDVTDKVLGANGGRSTNFKAVFAATQEQLRQVFGMEMVELPAKEKVTMKDKRSQKRKEASLASKSAVQYILVSVLPPAYRDKETLRPMNAGAEGSEGTYMGLYTLLVALVLLSGGQIPQAKMERYLRRLGLEDRTPIYGSEKTEKLLKRLEKEGYIQEVREKAMQGEEDISYVVGPRGKVEVGRHGVEGLVKMVYGEVEDTEEYEELERRIQRSLGVSEEVPKKVSGVLNGNGEGKKKRGRPKRGEVAEEEEGSGSRSEEEDEEGEELYE